jgi:hypothetical protein
MHGRLQVAQPVLAKIDEDAAITYELGNRRATDELPAVRGRHDASRAVDVRAEVVAVLFSGVTRVESHPGLQREAFRPVRTGQSNLGRDRARHSACRASKHGKRAIARALDHPSTVRVDRVAHHGVMHRQRGSHGVGLVLPQPRRALDIREKKRECALRLAGHHPILPPLVQQFRRVVRPTGSATADSASAGAICSSRRDTRGLGAAATEIPQAVSGGAARRSRRRSRGFRSHHLHSAQAKR